MARAWTAVLLLALCAAPAVEAVSPVQKVIELLEENKVKIASDLAAEEKEMEEYSEFCDDSLTTKGFAIKDATRLISELEAEITDGEAEIADLNAEVAALGTEMAEKEKQLGEKEAVRATAKAEFGKTEAELVGSIDSLERALATMKSSSFVQTKALRKPSKKAMEATLMAVSKIVDASKVNLRKHKVLKGLMQTTGKESADEELRLRGAPEAAAYESHTGGILEKFEEMKEKAEDALSDARTGETKEQHSFDMMTQSLTDSIKVGKEKLASAKEGIEVATEAAGKATAELTETKKTKAADEAYVKSLTKECEASKEEWAERQASASEEMAVIDKAKGILADRVKVFVQVGGKAAMQAVSRDDGDSDRDAKTRAQVMSKLKALSKQFRSYALMEVVTAAGADPFEKIKGLISEMIAKLLSEANEEATQKAFCDEETTKSNAAKEEKTMTSDKLTTRIDKATATKAELEGSVKELEGEVAALDKADGEATKIRNEENAAYLKASKDFKDAAEAVSEAITVLKEYYEGALVQVKSAKGPKFGGAKSDAASTILSILEMSAENFEKLYMESEREETEAKAGYEKLMEEDKISRTAKLAEVKGALSEIKSLEVAIKNGQEDLDTVTKELDAVLTYLEKLKPQCESKAMSYAERKSRREAEISGLKEALAILE